MDRLIGAYLLIGAAALLFPNRSPVWPLFFVTHIGGAAVLLSGLLDRVRRRAAAWRGTPGIRVVVTTLVDWYPLLLFPFFYWELPFLSGAVWDGRYFDARVLGWEEALFGSQPSTWLAARFGSVVLSEILHGAYLAYYPLIVGVPLALYLRRRWEDYSAAVFTLMLGLIVHYVVYIVYPVQGPRYLFPAPGGSLANGFMYRLAHFVLETGSSQGAAFPSSHAAIAALQAVVVARYLPKALPLVVLIALGISVGAVYGGFHYGIDILAGLGAGVGLALAAPGLRRRLR